MKERRGACFKRTDEAPIDFRPSTQYLVKRRRGTRKRVDQSKQTCGQTPDSVDHVIRSRVAAFGDLKSLYRCSNRSLVPLHRSW